jgi:hypothetical protein
MDYRANGLKSLDKAERMLKRYDDGKEVDSPLMKFFGDYRAHNIGADMVKKYVALRLSRD